jgi:hypothetical protein
MMKTKHIALFYLGVLFTLCTFQSYSQRLPMQFGKVDYDLVRMKVFESDTSAHAVILGDFGNVLIDYDNREGFRMRYTRHIRVKILHSMAFDEGDFKIPLYGSGGEREKITRFKARTYNDDNGRISVTNLKRKEGFEEQVSDYYKSFNFSMPNLREGSVIEVEYTINSPFFYSLPTWVFQNVYPTVFSEFRTQIPEYFLYSPLMQGFLQLSKHERTNQTRRILNNIMYNESNTLYRVNNAPAFRSEPYMNATINYLSKIEHELTMVNFPFAMTKDFTSTWAKLNKQLLDSESFGKQLNRLGFLSDEVQKIKLSGGNKVDQLKYAFETIRDEMTWNDRNTIYVNTNLRRAWNNKTGNVADINLLLVVLLRELDIDAHPVILSTRANGIVNPAQIMLNKFNYVVVAAEIDGKMFLLDATEKHMPYYLLPERCINGEGRLISEFRSRWVNLEAIKDNTVRSVAHISVKPCGSVHAQLQRTKENYQRLRLVNALRKHNNLDEFMEEFESQNQGIDLVNLTVENQHDWLQPLVCNYEFVYGDLDDTPKDVIYINPLMIDKLETNPFRLENREYPVDFTFPFQNSHTIYIEIPEGYEVDELPRNTNISLMRNQGDFEYKFEQNGRVIEVTMNFSITKPLFPINEYKALKEFYANRVEKQAQVIVLKRIQSK